MATPKTDRSNGKMEAKLQRQYKEKRSARQAEDAYGNAVKMTASSNPRRQRAGQALLDAIQSGPGGGGQDGSGMSANSIAREGMHAARAAALRGGSPAEQRMAYETAVKAAMSMQEFMQQQRRDKDARSFTLDRDKSKNEFEANQKDLDRRAELERAGVLAGGKKPDLKDRGTLILGLISQGKTTEEAKKIADEILGSGGATPMPGLPADTGPLSLLEEERRIAAQKEAEQRTRSRAASEAAQAEREKRSRLHGEWLRTLPVNGFRGGG